MLIEAYIEALLVDEGLADLVWEAWNIGIITDDLAAMVWAILAIRVGQFSVQIPGHFSVQIKTLRAQ